MPLLSRISNIAAAIETTVGTAETLDAGDGAIRAYDLKLQPTVAVENREAQGSFNYHAGIPGAEMGVATFKTDVYIGAALPAWASVLLPACGWVASTNTFTPRSESLGSNAKTVTIGKYLNGKLKSIAGAVGKFRLVLPTGRAAYFEWEFQGAWQDETDTTIISPTIPTTAAIRFASATCTYDSVAQKVESVTVDSGNVIQMREDPAKAGGYISGIIPTRYPKITANPEATLVATDDPYGDWTSGVEASFAISLDGPGTSALAITAPKAQIINCQESDRGQLATDDIEFACNKNGATADQELTLAFTLEV